MGIRNDLALPVAGWLIRAGQDPEDVEDLIYQVALAAGDEQADDRVKVVRPTAEKLERRERVVGWGKLAEVIGSPRAEALRRWLPRTDQDADDEATPFPAPLGILELVALVEREIEWRVAGLIEVGDKVLIAAYSKTHKTNLALELAVAVATRTRFLGKFDVPQPGRVGLVMMEDTQRHVAQRLARLAAGRGRTMEDLDGLVYVWPRPPLVLNSLASVQALREWVDELELDVLVVDNFALVSTGNSNNADEVTPQLVALTDLARNRTGLVVVLIHHGKKQGAENFDRMTDRVRGSGAFTAWYTCGIFLSRKEEDGPIEVHIELRNMPAPAKFKFDVKDEDPGDPEKGLPPTGWLRLYVVDASARDARTSAQEESILDYLRDNPACSRSQLRRGVGGKGAHVDRNFEQLCKDGRARVEEPPKRGAASRCYALNEDGRDDDTPSF